MKTNETGRMQAQEKRNYSNQRGLERGGFVKTRTNRGNKREVRLS